MSTETLPLAPGTFCWADLMTTDVTAARKFYSDLFGWDSNEFPMGPGATYTMFNKGGRVTAGLSAITDEMKTMGVRPSWMSHVYVESAEASATRAKTLGGTVVKGPLDAGGMGTMAVVVDPTGAVFSLWQPAGPLGDTLYNAPGGLTWNELWTSDVDRAGKFYSGLFDWKSDVQNHGPTPYTTFLNNNRPNGGMMTIPAEAAKMGAPPNWVVYFGVEDCDKSLAQATAAGATLLAPPMDIPGIGRFAILADPQGGAFAIIKLAR